MDMSDEIDVQIHFLVYEHLVATNPPAARAMLLESGLDLSRRPDNLGTLAEWWAEFEQSEYYDADSSDDEIEEVSLAERLWEMAVNNEKSA